MDTNLPWFQLIHSINASKPTGDIGSVIGFVMESVLGSVIGWGQFGGLLECLLLF